MTYVVNRNLDTAQLVDSAPDSATPGARSGPTTGGIATGGRALTLESIAELAAEAWELGATELCLQGEIPVEVRASQSDVIRAIRRRTPEIHLHAFRQAELADGARRRGVPLERHLSELRDAGLDSVPGTAARILDDGVRAALTGGTDIPVRDWIGGIIAAHRAGLRSTATMVYGHLETPAQQVAHLRTLRSIQEQTGGFSEFIPMPFLPQESPVQVPGLSRSGPSLDESRALHAVARLMLHGSIDHIQVAWTKLGLRAAQLILQGGADDLGGLLIDGELRPEAGAEAHRTLTIAEVERLAADIGRPTRQRTTAYGEPPVERLAAARRSRHTDTAAFRLTRRARAGRAALPVTER